MSLIQDDKRILKALQKRKEELELTITDIVRDAHIRGIHIIVPSLSKYLNESDENNITEKAVLWLCHRYNVKIGLEVEVLPYDEKECVKNAKEYLKKTDGIRYKIH